MLNSFRFVNVMWGETYTKLWLDVCLRSELFPNNMPAFKGTDSIYTIYTTKKEAELIRAADSFKELSSIMKTQIFYIEDIVDPDFLTKNKYTAMSDCHAHFIRSTQHEDSGLIIMSPDGVWSDYSFANVLKIAQTGKRLITVVGPRTNKETLLPEYLEKFGAKGPVGARDLVEIGIRNLHPEVECTFWHSKMQNNHPSWVLWKVGDEGVLNRAFHLHPIFIRPIRRDITSNGTIDGNYVLQACPDSKDVYIVTDSDEMFHVELSPPWKDGKNPNCPKTVLQIAQWARYGANARHLEFFKHKIRWHHKEISEQWKEVEQESDEIVNAVLTVLHRPQEQVSIDNATLSVLMLTHNSEGTVETALKALLEQSFKPKEIVVVDDGSTDKTVAVLDSLSKQHPCIKVIKLNEKKGLAIGLQIALNQSSGEFIYVASPDETVLPGFLEISVRMLSSYPNAGLCGSHVQLEHDDHIDALPSVQAFHNTAVNGYFTPAEFTKILERNNLGNPPLQTPTIVCRRSALLDAGGFLPELNGYGYIFAIQVMALRQGHCYVPEALVSQKESFVKKAIQHNPYSIEIVREVIKIIVRKEYQDIANWYETTAALSNNPVHVLKVITEKTENYRFFAPRLFRDITLDSLVKEKGVDTVELLKNVRDIYEQFHGAQKEVEDLVDIAQQAMARNEFKLAFETYGTVMRTFTRMPEGYIGYANAAVALQKVDEAARTLEEVMPLIHRNPPWINQVGVLYFKLGNFKKAQECFTQVIETNVGNLEAHNNLAILAVHENRLQDAMNHYTVALAVNPKDIDTILGYADLAMRLEQPKLARQALAKALDVDPSREEIGALLASLGA